MTLQPLLLVALFLLPVGAIAACRSAKAGSSEMQDPASRGHGSSSRFQAEVSYTNDIQPIIRNYCTTCHGGEDPEADLLLTSYAQVRAAVEHGELLSRIEDADDPMPTSGLMPTHVRRLVRIWAETGYVERGKVDRQPDYELESRAMPEIEPVVVADDGREFLERLQGHWVGDMWLMGSQLDWFAWDFRAIAPAHVHAIFEGGTIGNLFTSVFLADYKGTRTLMARNGGLLNGIYRTSYFLLADVGEAAGGGKTYRFVDAFGGADIMWMDFEFRGEAMAFSSYTSRFGMNGAPTKHMSFKGTRADVSLATAAARRVGFPGRVVQMTLPDGLPVPDWGKDYTVTSASYMWEEKGLALVDLGKRAGDPLRVDQMPHVGSLEVEIDRTPKDGGSKLLVYLSKAPLTRANGRLRLEWGYLEEKVGNSILLFPEVSAKRAAFTFTYLHPGDYYLTVIADLDGDGMPSSQDLSSVSQRVTVAPGERARARVGGVTITNS